MNPECVINPKSGRAVKTSGRLGQQILANMKDCKKILLSQASTPLREIINPLKIEVDDDFLHLNIDFPEDIDKLRNMIINNN